MDKEKKVELINMAIHIRSMVKKAMSNIIDIEEKMNWLYDEIEKIDSDSASP